jgi:integrase/recombinase XerD
MFAGYKYGFNTGDLRHSKFNDMTTRISKKVASVDAVLRTGHENNTGEQPVRVRVTYNRKARYYPVKFEGKPLYLKPDDWQKIKTGQKRKENRKIKEAVEDASKLARDARDTATANGQQFTFERFEAEYLVQESKKGFLRIFSDHLKELLKDERIGTYEAYKNAYTAFNKFRGATYERNGREAVEVKPGKELSPIDLTPEMLKKFEAFMKDSGAGRTTIAIYMRGLKVIYNICINHNPGLSEFYPFARKQNDKGKHKIKKGAGKKGEALTVDELQALINSETTPGLPDHEAKLLWLFSFYCQGMNFRDIGLLKYSNIKGEIITYIRQKTRNTEEEEKKLEIPLTDAIRDIIVTLGNPDKRPSAYVFGWTTKDMDAKTQYDTIKQKIKYTNKWLNELCKANDLPEITTYWARHSYANLLKQTGESVEFIRELLGHSDIKTTEAYLNRFDIDKKRKVNERIESLFKKKSA